MWGTPAMNERRKSDEPVVPKKRPNEGDGWLFPKEDVEGRGSAKGNRRREARLRTQRRTRLNAATERIRQVASRDRKTRFTALLHHVYDVDRLREAYRGLKRKGAPGVDGVTWPEYGRDLEGNLQDLSDRLRRGAYRARPVRRVHIPKPDGRTRPIGVPALEDKIVQRAFCEVMGAIYEEDFLGFSYGFRPKRSQHNALDALSAGLTVEKVNWVLDADIRGFFDAIDHGWLVRFLEHRIADRRIIRLVKKWLKAGILEDGTWRDVDEGTPQGGSASPLLANVYLHYVLDLWVHQWRGRQARGDVIIVRYADDFVVGFQDRGEAGKFLEALRDRLRKFSLELHPVKTRLLEFGRFAASDRQRRGDGKPPTFDFLGLTHICERTRAGKFVVRRKSSRKRVQRRLQELKIEIRRRMHDPPQVLGHWLQSVVRGWFRYHAVPLNYRSLNSFRHQVLRMVRRTWLRRSQKARCTWPYLERWAERWLPKPRILHPWPLQRLTV
jgi:RNA-directed DNA polymerase